MNTNRRRARIIAMQALCHHDVHADNPSDVVSAVAADGEFTASTIEHAGRLCTSFAARKAEIDGRIESALEKWSIDRVGSVERNVLRVAVVELDSGEVPPKVVINEAVEIAREFGTAESAGFVNGVLDRIWSDSRGGE